MRFVFILFFVFFMGPLLVFLPRARADECVRLARGTVIFSAPSAEAKAGAASAAVVAFVEQPGPWYRVRVEDLQGDRDRTRRGEVTFYVPKKAVTRARCPAPANLAMLEVLSSIVALRWKSGARAGSVHAIDAAEAAARSNEYVELDGEKNVCFDDPFVDGLSVHVCGSCAALRRAAGSFIGGDIFQHQEPPKKPCEERQ